MSIEIHFEMDLKASLGKSFSFLIHFKRSGESKAKSLSYFRDSENRFSVDEIINCVQNYIKNFSPKIIFRVK